MRFFFIILLITLLLKSLVVSVSLAKAFSSHKLQPSLHLVCLLVIIPQLRDIDALILRLARSICPGMHVIFHEHACLSFQSSSTSNPLSSSSASSSYLTNFFWSLHLSSCSAVHSSGFTSNTSQSASFSSSSSSSPPQSPIIPFVNASSSSSPLPFPIPLGHIPIGSLSIVLSYNAPPVSLLLKFIPYLFLKLIPCSLDPRLVFFPLPLLFVLQLCLLLCLLNL